MKLVEGSQGLDFKRLKFQLCWRKGDLKRVKGDKMEEDEQNGVNEEEEGRQK